MHTHVPITKSKILSLKGMRLEQKLTHCVTCKLQLKVELTENRSYRVRPVR